MRARLISRWGAVRGTNVEFEREATIGRHAENTIEVDLASVSGQHARIRWDAERERYLVEDLGSLNGTELDGRRLERPEPLDRLHLLDLGGECRFLFQLIEGDEVAAGTQVGAEAPELPAAMGRRLGTPREDAAEGTRVERGGVELPAGLAARVDEGATAAPAPRPPAETAPAYALVFAAAPGAPARALLAPGANVVGRAEDSDVEVDTLEVSRRHAVITVDGDRVTVRDLGSRNRTWIGDRPVEKETEIVAGDAVKFGGLEATLVREDAG